MDRKERMKKQMDRNKRNIRKMELRGYRRFSRMIPARLFDRLDVIVKEESDRWDEECEC